VRSAASGSSTGIVVVQEGESEELADQSIHWGLEWAGYGGKFGYRRYAAGVIAPAVAWPTLMPGN
jgi:hypothetical protein